MKVRWLYLTGGILCLAISFTIFIHSHVVVPLLVATRQYWDSSNSSSEASNPEPAQPRNGTTAKSKSNKRSERAQQPDVTTRAVTSPDPQVRVAPKQSFEATSQPTSKQPRVLSVEECANRIAAADRNAYVLIPRECQDQYRAWKLQKLERDRQEAQRRNENR